MTIRKRNDGWQVDVRVGGQRRRRDFGSVAGADACEAAWLAEAAGAPRSTAQVPLAMVGRVATSVDSLSGITLAALIERTYKDHWRGTRAGVDQYQCAVKAVEFFGPEFLAESVTTMTVDDYANWLLDTKKNTAGTVNRKLTALSVVLKHGRPRGAIKDLPELKKRAESETKKRIMAAEEEAALLKLFVHLGNEEFADLLVILIDTGARIDCEALRLRVQDVRSLPVPHIFIADGKFGKERVTPLSKRAQAAAQRCVARALASGRQRLFSLPSYRSALDVWNRGREALRLTNDADFTPHLCRHTCASRMAMAGVPLIKIMEWLGHSTITTTMRYAKIAADSILDNADCLERMASVSVTNRANL